MIATILILAGIGIVFTAWAAFTKKDYNGFASTTCKKAWNGEISGADIKILEKIVADDAQNPNKKHSTTIPL